MRRLGAREAARRRRRPARTNARTHALASFSRTGRRERERERDRKRESTFWRTRIPAPEARATLWECARTCAYARARAARVQGDSGPGLREWGGLPAWAGPAGNRAGATGESAIADHGPEWSAPTRRSPAGRPTRPRSPACPVGWVAGLGCAGGGGRVPAGAAGAEAGLRCAGRFRLDPADSRGGV